MAISKRSLLQLLCVTVLGGVFVWLLSVRPTVLSAGDNLDMQLTEGGPIWDLRWDPRLFSGGGFIEWFHNTANKPAAVNQAAFETEIEAAFDNWEAVGALTGAPTVPELTIGSGTTSADPTALDGIYTVGWVPVDFGGFLARAPCYFLTADTVTIDVGGETHLPIGGGGSIPFPGPPGVTYPPGTAVDCWMEFDSVDAWSTAAGAVPNQFDVQAIATHEGGHFLGVSHSTVGLALGLNAETSTMVPAGSSGNIDLRSLTEDDIASFLRTYARNATPPLAQTAGGRGLIQFTLGQGAACDPATGVPVWAYETAGGIDGANRVETFSGSQFRDPAGDPYNGSVKLNVTPGGPYTIYARLLEDNGTSSAGLYSAFRYSNTTINSNAMDPNALTMEFDNIATVASIAAGATVDLGMVGIKGCWVPVPISDIDIEMTASTAPATALLGGSIAVTSNFTNSGTAPAGPFEVGFYFSQDAVINTDDAFSGFTCSVAGLAVGASDTCNGTIEVPAIAPGMYYVGALADIENAIPEPDESNNALDAAPTVDVTSDIANPLVNGSFEDNGGSFHGWNIKELSRASNPQQILTVAGAGVAYPADQFSTGNWILDFFNSQPTDGSWAAMHDFNGIDWNTLSASLVNRRELYQDLTLPVGTTTLTFDYRAAWELYRFGATQDRTFSVEIQPAGGGTPLHSETILLATAGDEPPTGAGFEEDTDNPTGVGAPYPAGLVDLSTWAGQDIRLMFVWNVPEPGTGFSFFQLDNLVLNVDSVTDIAITEVGAPASVTKGDTPTVTVTVQNVGNQDVVDLEVSLTPTAGGGAVTNSPQMTSLVAGASTTLNFSWDTSGGSIEDHTLTATHNLSDDNASNDSAEAVVTLNAPSSGDLIVTAFTAPTAGVIGSSVSISASVENQGALEAGSFDLAFYFSADGALDGGDVRSSTTCSYALLGVGVTDSATCDNVAVNVPGGLNAGSYTLIARVDDLGVVTESNESNNTRTADTGMINVGFNACPADLILENQTLTGTQTLEATSSATLGPDLTVNGTNIVVNAPTVTFLGNTSISGPFSVGTNPGCP